VFRFRFISVHVGELVFSERVQSAVLCGSRSCSSAVV